MDEREREELRELRSDVRKLRDDMQPVRQAVVGIDGRGGLLERVARAEDRLASHDRFRAALPVAAIALILSAIATIIGTQHEAPDIRIPDVNVDVRPPEGAQGAGGLAGGPPSPISTTPDGTVPPGGDGSPSPSPSPTPTGPGPTTSPTPPPPPPGGGPPDVAELVTCIVRSVWGAQGDPGDPVRCVDSAQRRARLGHHPGGAGQDRHRRAGVHRCGGHP